MISMCLCTPPTTFEISVTSLLKVRILQLQLAAVTRQRVRKHVLAAPKTHATTKDLMQSVFYTWHV